MHTGLVFNIQKYSVQDGPGIRTTVFLKGCPLCCAWCHNPEGIAPRREIIVLERRCLVCGECRNACPYAESLAGAGALPARHERCELCGACSDACPAGARQIIGQEMTVTEVMNTVLQDRIFYEDSVGGMTISGGEPLLQPQFVRALLESCRDHGLHAAVDTCGFGCTDQLLAIARLTDLVLYDLKFMDDAKHRQFCGVSNVPILENLQALDKFHDNIWLRVPVIPGINDTDENLEAVARFAASLHSVRQVNLLPYHETGLQKFRRLDRAYRLEGVQKPSEDQMQSAVDTFRAYGLTAWAGG